MSHNIEDAIETTDSLSQYANSRPTQHLPANQSDLAYVKEFQKNIELDCELGLKGQAKEAAKKLVDKDIEEILKGEPYTEVNINDLEKLFGIPRMRRQSVVWNFFQKYKFSMGSLTAGIISLNACWFLAHSSFFVLDNVPTLGEVWMVIACIALGVGAVAGVVMGAVYIHPDNIPRHPRLVVDLQVEDVRETSMTIPYGAKLRLKEAYDTGKFDNFKIAYPQPSIQQVDKPAPKIVDPAIIGCKRNTLTHAEKWYMIVFWDIPKDKEITEKKIKELKKFKLV